MHTTNKPKRYKKPNAFLYYLFTFLLYPFFKLKGRVHMHNRAVTKIKGPYILLANHESAPDFIYAVGAVWPRRANIVIARNYTYYPFLGRLLSWLRVIPKRLFCPDNETIKGIMQHIKAGHIVVMMPEGRLSTAGIMGTRPEGLGKLLKKLAVPVVGMRIEGAYFTKAKWIKQKRHGRIDVTCELLFSNNDFTTETADEIDAKIDHFLAYNDYEWLVKHPDVHFHSKNMASGLEQILYRCPKCHQEFTQTSTKHHLVCQNCQNTVLVTSRYELKPVTSQSMCEPVIHKWMDWQKKLLKQEIEAGLTLEAEVIYKKAIAISKEKTRLKEVGRGICHLDQRGLTYEGSDNGAHVKLFFACELLPTLLFGCDEDFEVYHDTDFHYFAPIENRIQAVKWSIYAELAYEIDCEKKKRP